MPFPYPTIDECIQDFIKHYVIFKGGRKTHANTFKDAFYEYMHDRIGRNRLYQALLKIDPSVSMNNGVFKNITVIIVNYCTPKEREMHRMNMDLERIKIEGALKVREMEMKFEAKKQETAMRMLELRLELAKANAELVRLGAPPVEMPEEEPPKDINAPILPPLRYVGEPTAKPAEPVVKQSIAEQMQPTVATAPVVAPITQVVAPVVSNDDSDDSDDSDDDTAHLFDKPVDPSKTMAHVEVIPDEPYAEIKRRILDVESDDEYDTDEEEGKPHVSWRAKLANVPLENQAQQLNEIMGDVHDKINKFLQWDHIARK